MRIYDGNQYVRRMLEATQTGRIIPELYYEVQECPDTVIYVWDGVNSRKQRQLIYPEYKTHRTPAGESIYENIKLFKQILTLSKAIQVEVPGWEADDVIGTLVGMFREEHKIHIRSNDSDFLPLTGNGVTLDRTEYAVAPRWVRLYKTMVGDPKDTVPGIKNFGKIAWAKFNEKQLQKFEGFLNGSHGLPEDLPFTPAVYNWLSVPANQLAVQTYYRVKSFIPVPTDLIDKYMKEGIPRPDLVEPIFQEHLL